MEISINMNVRIALIWYILGHAVSNVITSEEIVSHDEGNHHEQMMHTESIEAHLDGTKHA